ncbi:hypothetical protein J6590_044246 [Homalodisca vitripennis]|nr:hypothetical protein J6590_044246 [Homalodisca vitripennis]
MCGNLVCIVRDPTSDTVSSIPSSSGQGCVYPCWNVRPADIHSIIRLRPTAILYHQSPVVVARTVIIFAGMCGYLVCIMRDPSSDTVSSFSSSSGALYDEDDKTHSRCNQRELQCNLNLTSTSINRTPLNSLCRLVTVNNLSTSVAWRMRVAECQLLGGGHVAPAESHVGLRQCCQPHYSLSHVNS